MSNNHESMNINERTLVNRIEAISKLLMLGSVLAVLFGAKLIIGSVLEIVPAISESAGRAVIAHHIKEFCEGLVMVVHYTLVLKFFIHCLKHGVPFTHDGAKEVRILGLETIFLPLLVELISVVAFGPGALEANIVTIEIYELVFGVFIFQTGFVMDYGTMKISAGHHYHKVYRYIREKYPELIEEAEANIEIDVEKKQDYIID